MHAVILHGGNQTDAGLEGVYVQLSELLRDAGWSSEIFRVAELTVHPCIGCFSCWLRTPGECVFADDGRAIARAFVQSDARIYLTPVSFGGYSGTLKTAINRMIPTISPLFQQVHGEIHHRLRYPNVLKLLAVGWQARAQAEGAEIFAQLVQRNAINMHAPASGSVVLTGAHTLEERHRLLADALQLLEAAS